MKLLYLLVSACALLLSSQASHAQTSRPQTKVIVLKAARMFDGKSDRLVSPGVVIIAGEKIQAVGPSVVIPAAAEVIDLGDATLLPGFMDAHTHLSFEASDDWKQDELDF